MKNKKIFVILLSVIIACIISVLFFVKKMHTPAQLEFFQEEYSVFALMQALNVQEIDSFAEEAECTVERNGKYIFVTDDSFFDTEFEAFFTVEGERVSELTGSFMLKTPVSQLEDTGVVYQYVNKIVSIFNSLFDYQITQDHYHIYAPEGYALDLDAIDTYAMLTERQAVFGLYVRDLQETLWIINGTVVDDHLVFTYTRHFNTDLYRDFMADLVIE